MRGIVDESKHATGLVGALLQVHLHHEIRKYCVKGKAEDSVGSNSEGSIMHFKAAYKMNQSREEGYALDLPKSRKTGQYSAKALKQLRATISHGHSQSTPTLYRSEAAKASGSMGTWQITR